MILDFTNSRLPGTVGAAIKSVIGLDAVSDDLAAAVIADRRKLVNCTLETVKGMSRAGRHNLERQIIIVAADFTFRHER